METNFQIEDQPIKKNVPFRELIGSLLYLATISRPDIQYSVIYLSRFLDKPTEQLWQAAKRILRYLKATQYICLTYEASTTSENLLMAYTDADWGSDQLDRKSVSGYAVFINKKLVSRCSKKQCVVQSSQVTNLNI